MWATICTNKLLSPACSPKSLPMFSTQAAGTRFAEPWHSSECGPVFVQNGTTTYLDVAIHCLSVFQLPSPHCSSQQTTRPHGQESTEGQVRSISTCQSCSVHPGNHRPPWIPRQKVRQQPHERCRQSHHSPSRVTLGHVFLWPLCPLLHIPVAPWTLVPVPSLREHPMHPSASQLSLVLHFSTVFAGTLLLPSLPLRVSTATVGYQLNCNRFVLPTPPSPLVLPLFFPLSAFSLSRAIAHGTFSFVSR